jgi:hypothetical protein
MAGKNDILATAGVDLSAFEAGIAKLTSRLDAVEKSGSKAASGIEKVGKSTNALKNIQVFDHVVSALGQIASGGGVAANAMKQLDERAAFNNFGGAADNMAKFGAVAGNTIDVFSRMPGRLGAIAAVGQIVATNITDQTQAYKALSAEQKHVAHTTDAMIAKDVKYAETQKELAKLHLLYNQNDNRTIDAITEARKQNAVAFEEQAKKEKDAISDTTAGASARLSMLDVETERLQKISDLKANLSGPGGKLSVGKEGMFSLGSDKINAEAEAKKKILSVSEVQEKSETKLSNIVAKRDVTYDSQLSVIKDTGNAIGEVLAEVERQGLGQTSQAAELRVKLNENLLAYKELKYTAGKDLEQQKLITAQINAQAAGNKKLAALAQIRAQFELQIADAIRQGNGARAKELAMQQAMAELQAKADDFLKTPQERQKEKKEQQERNRGLRGAAGREFGKLSPEEQQKEREKRQKEQQEKRDKKAETDKGNSGKKGAYGRVDSNDFTSKPTQEAVKEFQDRAAKANIAAGNAALNQAGNFQAEKLTVGELKNAP